MKKYNNYKDSGIDWIGEIPSNWSCTKLKFHTKKIIDGAHFTPTYIEKSNDSIPFLRVTDLHSKEILLDEVKYIPLSEHQELIKRCNPEMGDLLLSKNGTIGLMKIIDWDWEFSIFVSLCLLKFESSLLNKFFYYFFESNIVDRQLFESSQKTSVSNLHLEKIKELRLTLPSIEEQKIIANYLDHKTSQIDTLIAKKEQFINLLQEERTSLINQAVTKSFDPKVKMKDSGIEWLGEIPEQWKLMKIGSLSQCITGYAFKSDNFSFENGIKIVRGDNVTENSLRWGDKTRYWNEYSEALDKFQLQKNDIVIGMDGSKVGKNYAYIEERDLPLLLVQRVARVRPTNELIAKWIHFNIGSYNFKYYINLSKTDPAIPHITLKNITNYPICVPGTDELNLIIKKLTLKLEKLDETIKKSNQEIEVLQEYKTALISEVVTGKIDIRDVILN